MYQVVGTAYSRGHSGMVRKDCGTIFVIRRDSSPGKFERVCGTAFVSRSGLGKFERME